MTSPTLIQMVGATLFGLAVLHTFSTKLFERLALTQPRHAGIWHFLGEVEVVANAPNPAGAAILKEKFSDNTIHPLGLIFGALPPTLVVILVFKLL